MNDLIFVGYTNGYQILYAAESEGAFYPDGNNDSYIPLYMLKGHAHRIENTTCGSMTLETVLAKRKQVAAKKERFDE